jgi:hypothetical protein
MNFYTLTVNNRITEICRYYNNIQTDLVKLGLGSKQTISHIFNHRQVPNYEFLSGFLKFFKHVDARWLITGEGVMLQDNSNSTILTDKEIAYGKDALQFVHELSKEIGKLEIQISDLEIENRRLRKKCEESDMEKARAG